MPLKSLWSERPERSCAKISIWVGLSTRFAAALVVTSLSEKRASTIAICKWLDALVKYSVLIQPIMISQNVFVSLCEGLVDSLRQYCAAEMLEGDSAYQCDVCKKKQTALRSTVLRSVPPILTFSCNRCRNVIGAIIIHCIQIFLQLL